MLRYKISKIAKSTNRSYRSAKRRVLILAPVMQGKSTRCKIDAACEQILSKIEDQRMVFRNVNFSNLYKDLI